MVMLAVEIKGVSYRVATVIERPFRYPAVVDGEQPLVLAMAGGRRSRAYGPDRQAAMGGESANGVQRGNGASCGRCPVGIRAPGAA
jgi:hypothetical protein